MTDATAIAQIHLSDGDIEEVTTILGAISGALNNLNIPTNAVQDIAIAGNFAAGMLSDGRIAKTLPPGFNVVSVRKSLLISLFKTWDIDPMQFAIEYATTPKYEETIRLPESKE